MKAPTVGGGCKELAGRPLVSCNRSSQQKSAPKERHNVAHGVKPWVGAPSLSPFPSPARAGEGCRRRSGGYSLPRAAPWANIFRPFGATLSALPAQPDLVNELETQDTSMPPKKGT